MFSGIVNWEGYGHRWIIPNHKQNYLDHYPTKSRSLPNSIMRSIYGSSPAVIVSTIYMYVFNYVQCLKKNYKVKKNIEYNQLPPQKPCNREKMPVIDCPFESCEYVTLDVGEVVAAALIITHTTIHNITASHGAVSQIANVHYNTLVIE